MLGRGGSGRDLDKTGSGTPSDSLVTFKQSPGGPTPLPHTQTAGVLVQMSELGVPEFRLCLPPPGSSGIGPGVGDSVTFTTL